MIRCLGGLHNDIYVVLDSNDKVTEYANQGQDTVWSFVSNYTLTANVENLVLRKGANNGTGNNLDNRITGNSGNNLLSGKGGDDVLIGGGGNDRLLGASSFRDADIDTLTGGSGNDDFIVGNDHSNLYKNAGNNDYALITDMARGDRIILDQGNYSLGASPVAGVSGTAIFEESELLAIVQGVSSQQLTFRNQSYTETLEFI